MKYLLCLLFLLQTTWSLAQQTVVTHTKKIVSSEVDWWKFSKDDYSILHPQDWTVDTSKTMGSSFILFAPVEGPNDVFKENVNLLIQDFKGKNITLTQYVQYSEEQIRKMIKHSNVLESKRIKAPEGEYHSISFTGEQGNHKLRFEQRYYLRNNKSYVLTFTYEQIKIADYQRIGDLIFSSFKFVD
jgi:hypothetical protein